MIDQICLDLQKALNLSIAYYFFNTLVSPHNNSWHHIDGPITQTMDHLDNNSNHRRSVENIYKIVISCIEQEVKYTGRNVT